VSLAKSYPAAKGVDVRPRKSSLLLLALLCALLAALAQVPASAGYEFPICTAPGGQYWPAISGNIVVWADCRDAGDPRTNSDIYGYDLRSGREFPVCTTPGSQGQPAISGNIVVWPDT
jgi:beta propeller repeat protein